MKENLKQNISTLIFVRIIIKIKSMEEGEDIDWI